MKRYVIFGDIHNSFDEMLKLVSIINEYDIENNISDRIYVSVGDLIDKNDKPMEVLSYWRQLIITGKGMSCIGNHESKFIRWLNGNNVKISNGLQETIDGYKDFQSKYPMKARIIIEWFIDYMKNRPPFYKLDNGNLIIVHGAVNDNSIKKHKLPWLFNKKCSTWAAALYGFPTGEYNSEGLPIRDDSWIQKHKSKEIIVYGHVIHKEVKIENNTYGIDTGAGATGKLSALLYPEILIKQVEVTKKHK